MSVFTDNHMNPLDIDVNSLDVGDSNGLIRMKAEFMLANLEFIVMLNQSNPDAVRIEETIGISKTQLRFVSNAPIGTGL